MSAYYNCNLIAFRFVSNSAVFSLPPCFSDSNLFWAAVSLSCSRCILSTCFWSSSLFLLILSYFFLMTTKLWCADTSSILSIDYGSFLNLLKSLEVANDTSPYLNPLNLTWPPYWSPSTPATSQFRCDCPSNSYSCCYTSPLFSSVSAVWLTILKKEYVRFVRHQ